MPGRRSSGFQLFLVIVCLNVFFLVKYSTDVPISLSYFYRNDDPQPAFPGEVTQKPPLAELAPAASTTNASLTLGSVQQINKIRLIGERHSGTTYLTRYLQGCFSKREVLDFLVRKKHWFQPSPDAILQAAQSMDQASLAEATDFKRFDPEYKTWWDIAHAPNPKDVFKNSLVLCVVRDPYQWMEAMRRGPWHWPNHLTITPKTNSTIATMKYRPDKDVRRRRLLDNEHERPWLETPKGGKSGDVFPGPVRVQKSYVDHTALEWKEFVRTPMRLLDEDQKRFEEKKLCHKGFPKGSISPCFQNHSYVPPSLSHIPIAFLRNLPFSVQDVVYELQLNGEPFEHPLALRSAKIRNLLSMEQKWNLGGFRVLRYEDILGGMDNGTHLYGLVEEIEKLLGVSSQCKPHKVVPKTPYVLPKDFADWIDDNADWDVEGRLGYSRVA